MKSLILISFITLLSACSHLEPGQGDSLDSKQVEQTVSAENDICPGTAELPPQFIALLTPVSDEPLLKSTLGAPGEGMLCQGKVYEVNKGARLMLYRAWNSTNPDSRLGNWWAFYRPDGLIAQYREDYEICYQWSPLDKLTNCLIKPGTRVVVGTGQSARCSQYLTYAASAAQQIYLSSASDSVSSCNDHNAFFRWQKIH